MHGGWHQIAFERDLHPELTPAAIGDTDIVLVREEHAVRAFRAACPHRGANLAHGGRLDGQAIVCPFHGKRISLGRGTRRLDFVEEFHCIGYGGMIFVRASGPDTGLTKALDALCETHAFVPGFDRNFQVRADMVIENGFDAAHFKPVHGTLGVPHFSILASECGEFGVQGTLEVPPSPWQSSGARRDVVTVPFTARAYSPYIVISHMGGEDPYVVITSATPLRAGGCTVRLSLALPNRATRRRGSEQDPEGPHYLLRQSLAGLMQDATIWEHLVEGHVSRYDGSDAGVVAFRDFCRAFDGTD